MLTQGSCAEEEISGGEADAPEAIPNGEAVTENRAEGSTPADRPMGELFSDQLMSALEYIGRRGRISYILLQCLWRKGAAS